MTSQRAGRPCDVTVEMSKSELIAIKMIAIMGTLVFRGKGGWTKAIANSVKIFGQSIRLIDTRFFASVDNCTGRGNIKKEGKKVPHPINYISTECE